jgi:hypothetical protein
MPDQKLQESIRAALSKISSLQDDMSVIQERIDDEAELIDDAAVTYITRCIQHGYPAEIRDVDRIQHDKTVYNNAGVIVFSNEYVGADEYEDFEWRIGLDELARTDEEIKVLADELNAKASERAADARIAKKRAELKRAQEALDAELLRTCP